jgi:hypothetical protein
LQGAGVESRIVEFVDRHWKSLLLVGFVLLCAWEIAYKWTNITHFILTDTDDNLRLAQVRAWLNHGQGWYDLKQYKMNWPAGADIHWSRLVDLPIAGLILLGRLFLDGPQAEIFAIALAPLVPLALLLLALALIVRRLVHPAAWPLAFICLFFAGSGLGQYHPTRIDHHGWQLAFLLLGVAGIADPKRARGGAVLGIAGALSLAIGLESIVYIALLGVAMVLWWVVDGGQRRRLAAYAAAIAGGTALSFLVFASYANRAPVCDALSPVWLSDALLGGALMLGLAWWSPASWKARLAGAAAAGLILAGFHALAWPHCLSRLEGISPEVYQLWLKNVREARPVYRHGWRIATLILTLPVTGLIGWTLLAWTARQERDRLIRVIAAMLPCLAATGLLFWQTRTGPAAQLTAIPGAVALAVVLTPILANSRVMLVRTLGTAAAVLLALGALVPLALDYVVPDKPKPQSRNVNAANGRCPTMAAMRPLQELPPSVIFTFADLTPRLIAITKHRGIIGPYHRNQQQIADSMMLFRGDAANARRLLDKYRADYLMTCPNMSQATIYSSEAPKGFYVQLEKGQVPAWLQPVPLPAKSPLKLWKVVR